ncbi:MAG: hypothetical protein KIT46_08265 [Anaerolineales bacterium]|nr:hypothetical protein [Anaerolineales bacterium]MCW5856024.1 hypothetical protein [Anaerolineales bacterium]
MTLHCAKWLIFISTLLISCAQLGQAVAVPVAEQTAPSDTPSSPLTSSPSTEETYQVSLGELSNKYSNCDLPCWWGVTPGETTKNEFNQEWSSIFRSSEYYVAPSGDSGWVEVVSSEDEVIISMKARFEFSADQKLGSLNITTLAYSRVEGGLIRLYGEETYIRLTDNYSLDMVLRDFGLPEAVRFYLEIAIAEPTAPNAFILWLSYPEEGVILEYTTRPIIETENPVICIEDLFFNAWLFSPGDLEGVRNKMNEFVGPYTLDVEQVYGITVDEFHKKFQRGGEECMTIPVDIWPPP